MDELLFNKRYHINYLLETKFDKRLYDAYIGYSTSRRPPYIEDIFEETMQMQALLLLESVKENPWTAGYVEEQWEVVQESVWEDDGIAKLEVLGGYSDDEVDAIIRDILGFFYRNQLSTLTGKNTGYIAFINAPLKEVW